MSDTDDKARRGDKPRRFDKNRSRGARPGGGENKYRPGGGENKYRPRGERNSGQRFAPKPEGERGSGEAGGGGERPVRKFEGRKFEGRKFAGRKFEGSKIEGSKIEGSERKDFRPRGGESRRANHVAPLAGRGDKKWPRKEFGDKKWPRKERGGERRPVHDERVHQRDLVRVAGRGAVKALFAHAPDRVERLFFSREMTEETAGYRRVMAKARKVFREAVPEELARIAGTVLHGGIVAVAKPKPVRDFDPAEAARWAAEAPLLPILHGVANPHNFGAIVRTMAFLGIPRLVLTDHPAQAGLSDAALRVAEGGFEALDVYRATSVAGTLRRLKENYRVLGAAVGRGLTLERVPRDRPIALVLGNEEAGLDAAILAACDEAVTIAGAGSMQSLNVSVAAGILLYMLKPPAA
ncbi:MAG: RNA methyltransferase [Pseudomonadota bacterium]